MRQNQNILYTAKDHLKSQGARNSISLVLWNKTFSHSLFYWYSHRIYVKGPILTPTLSLGKNK